MKILKKAANMTIDGSFSQKKRLDRIKFFYESLSNYNLLDIKILDIGGSSEFWDIINQKYENKFHPILVNISKDWIINGNYNKIIGDGCNLKFIKDKSVDFVFSNSVIEHLKSFTDQKEMAKNIERISHLHFIQTPAFIFPIEPHFLFPFFHWLPKSFQIWLLMKFDLGWYKKCETKNQAKALVDSIRIMKKNELKQIFPNSKIIIERWLLFSKSYMVTNIK